MIRFFQALGAIVAIWVFGSFAGVMFDPSSQRLWTQSLMWSLLASVILAPAFIFIGTAPANSSSQPSSNRPSSTSSRTEQSFDVDENVEVSQQEQETTEKAEPEQAENEGWPHDS